MLSASPGRPAALSAAIFLRGVINIKDCIGAKRISAAIANALVSVFERFRVPGWVFWIFLLFGSIKFSLNFFPQNLALGKKRLYLCAPNPIGKGVAGNVFRKMDWQ